MESTEYYFSACSIKFIRKCEAWINNPDSGKKIFTVVYNNSVEKGIKADKNTVIECLKETIIVNKEKLCLIRK